MRFAALSIACLPLFFSFSAAGQTPKLRLGEVQNVSPTRYQAELTLDPNQPQFSGVIRIGLKIPQSLQTLWLNGTALTIQDASLSAAGRAWNAKASPAGEDFLRLDFHAPVPAGTAELQIRYSGAVDPQSTSGVFRLNELGNAYIYTQFESTSARRAFPSFDEPSYKVPWQLTLHVPAGDQAVSNTPVSRQTGDGSGRTFVFKETRPLPSYLIAFAVGPLEFVDGGKAGRNHVPVRIVVPKGRTAEAKYAAEVTATILSRLEDYFGVPYPYEKSDQVSVPAVFGAMENAGMVTYQQSWLLGNPAADSISRQREYASVAAHELAHQWFGDLVTMAWWNDLWLNEAFATWMSQKILAEWKPEWNTRLSDVNTMLSGERADSLTTARKIRQEIVTEGDIDNAADTITYDKGAAVIGMFERWIGPERFRQGVSSYLGRHADRNATATDFLTAQNAASKKDVAPAFSSFLDQTGVPVVSVSLDCQSKGAILHLAQSRYVRLGSPRPAQQIWQIPVSIRYSRGGSESKLLTQAKADWPLQSCPGWVDANADARGYYRVDYGGGLLAALSGSDIEKRLNAAERLELMGNVRAMAAAGVTPEAEVLRLAEKLHNDPQRQVVSNALGADTAIEQDLTPDNLLPNYRRFLLKNYQARAHELGWNSRPGEPDEIRLLRPELVPAVARSGGDQELAAEARRLAERWFQDRKAVNPDMVAGVLTTAAYYGDAALHSQMLAEVEKTQDQREQQQLLSALASFRDAKLLDRGLDEVLAGRIPLNNAIGLLLGSGSASRPTRKVAFDFLKAHFDRLMAGNPTIQGFSVGALLPNVGRSFCDADSRRELIGFFTPLTKKYEGSQRTLDQTMETIDQCVALVEAQRPSVEQFLAAY